MSRRQTGSSADGRQANFVSSLETTPKCSSPSISKLHCWPAAKHLRVAVESMLVSLKAAKDVPSTGFSSSYQVDNPRRPGDDADAGIIARRLPLAGDLHVDLPQPSPCSSSHAPLAWTWL